MAIVKHKPTDSTIYSIEDDGEHVTVADGFRLPNKKRYDYDSSDMPSEVFWELVDRLRKRRPDSA